MSTQPLFDAYEQGQPATVTLTRAELREIRRRAFVDGSNCASHVQACGFEITAESMKGSLDSWLASIEASPTKESER